MKFVDNDGLPEFEGGDLAIEVDNEESDGEVVPEEVLAIEVDADGVPDDAEVPWDETVIPDGVGVEEIDWSPWYAKCPTYGEVWRVVCEGSRRAPGYTLYTPQGSKQEKRRLYFDHRLCVPWALVPYVLREHHELGHWGVEKLTLELLRRYRWGPIAKHTQKRYGTCRCVGERCQCRRRRGILSPWTSS